jgi:hypothetical protein
MLNLEGESMTFDLKKLTLTLAAAALPIGAAQAALHDRGRGLIYDDVMNVTWMADTNYGVTSGGFDALGFTVYNGQVNWYDAVTWAQYLEYGGYDDWRLASPLNRDGSGPVLDQCQINISCDNSEFGYMFYRNLDVPYPNITAPVSFVEARNIANLALFINPQPKPYWTNLRTQDLGYAYVFDLGMGRHYYQDTQDNYGDNRQGWGIAWAVRDGDVIDLSPVPEPQTAALMLAGVCLTGWAARRRRHAAIV